MPAFEFDMPDGSKKRAIGDTPEQAWENLNAALPPEADRARGPNPGEHGRKFGGANEIFEGIFQGLIDPFEGVAQLAEHMAGRHLVPEAIRSRARDFRKKVQSTTGGQLGEIGGNIAGMIIPGGLAAKGLGLAGRAAGGIPTGIRLTANALEGGLAAGAQPVQGARNDADYWRTKNAQLGWGMLGGGAFPTLGALARRAGNIGTHFSWHHPMASLFGMTAAPAIGAAGQAASRLPPSAVGAAAGTVTEQAPDDEDFR